MQNKIGKINIPYGSLPSPKELVVASLLAQSGRNVTFIPVGPIHTPDIIYDNRRWEIKSPEGSSKYTIENNIRRALSQSENIILDLQYIRSNEEDCLKKIVKQINVTRQIKKIIVITKRKNILILK